MIGHLELAIGTLTSQCLMGVAYKNLSAKADFSQMCPSRSRFDYERNLCILLDQWLEFNIAIRELHSQAYSALKL